MSCIEKVLARRSVRKFTDTPVSEEVLNNILEAGRLAPSATNNQPWHFVVVGFYRQSEVIIEKLSLMDVTISLQNMVIAGWIQGVSSCWMGAFDERKLQDSLELPSDARIVGAIAFGISNEKPRQPPKKPTKEIFHFEKWQSR